MKAIITFPHYDSDQDDEVYKIELPDNPCFNEPDPGLKWDAEVQIGYIRNDIKLLYKSIHPNREVCNVKFDFEFEERPIKTKGWDEVFELPDHLKTQRNNWIMFHNLREYYGN